MPELVAVKLALESGWGRTLVGWAAKRCVPGVEYGMAGDGCQSWRDGAGTGFGLGSDTGELGS